MFDLGARWDWWNLAPMVVDSINQHIPGLLVAKSMDKILEDANIDLERIRTIVFSHWH